MSPIVILSAGLLTLLLRGAVLVGGPRKWEHRAAPYLKRMPAAVLPALATSSLLAQTGSVDGVARIIAAGVATAVAWRTRNLLATLGGGMAALWLLRSLGV